MFDGLAFGDQRLAWPFSRTGHLVLWYVVSGGMRESSRISGGHLAARLRTAAACFGAPEHHVVSARHLFALFCTQFADFRTDAACFSVFTAQPQSVG